MHFNEHFFSQTSFKRWAAIALIAVAPLTQAATFWTGSNTNLTQANGQDVLVAGAVSLKRGSDGGPLYNGLKEGGPDGATSPTDTMWAFGSLPATNFTYQTFAAIRLAAKPNLSAALTNKQMVLHLTNEDIYISIKFVTWVQHSGSFSYIRSTPAVAVTPTIAITNPLPGAIFTAPANVSLTATGAVSSGSITNVAFFRGATSIGNVTASPFTITASSLAAGSYALTAVATAGGVSATSAVVNITVVNPSPTVSISTPTNGAIFAAPANVSMTANAAVTSGTVTNVAYFRGTTLIGSATGSPFSVTASNLAAGPYGLTAVATASGISSTSAVVNINVITSSVVSNSLPKVANNQFTFRYNADAGLSYVIENSTNLTTWVPIATNVASGSPVLVTNAFNANGSLFYRVGRRPNP